MTIKDKNILLKQQLFNEVKPLQNEYIKNIGNISSNEILNENELQIYDKLVTQKNTQSYDGFLCMS